MENRLVEYTAGGQVARLTLNSPHNRNALSSTLVSQLHQGLRDAADDPAVRVVVLGHTGNTFCAGADLRGSPPSARGDREGGAAGRSGSQPSARGDREGGAAGRSGSPPSARGDREGGAAGRSGSPPSASEGSAASTDPAEATAQRSREMAALLRAIVEAPLPVIVAVDGHVRAGGMGLVAAADIAIAGPRSTFALTEARIGVAPAIISLTLLPKLSSRAAARYYLTGETFDAATAQTIGLVTIAADDVDAALASLVADIGRGSPQGLAASKALTTAAVLNGFDRDAERLGAESARLFVSDEAREGMLAFLEKRPPRWVS